MVLNANYFAAEANLLPSDSNTYRIVNQGSSLTVISAIEDGLRHTIDTFHLPHSDSHTLLANFPFTPATFKLIPKIHKALGSHGIKGRPVVSCRNYCTTCAPRYIDFHIKSCIHSTTSKLRDTSDVVRNLANLQGRLAADCYLITADVESLYTNMDWGDHIDALNVYPAECTHPLKELLPFKR